MGTLTSTRADKSLSDLMWQPDKQGEIIINIWVFCNMTSLINTVQKTMREKDCSGRILKLERLRCVTCYARWKKHREWLPGLRLYCHEASKRNGCRARSWNQHSSKPVLCWGILCRYSCQALSPQECIRPQMLLSTIPQGTWGAPGNAPCGRCCHPSVWLPRSRRTFRFAF